MSRPPTPPDIRQEHSYTCGPAAAESIARAFGKRAPKVTCSTRVGSYVRHLADGLEVVGLRVQYGAMRWEDVTYHLRRGRLLAVIMPAGRESHWVVVSRVQRGWVRVQDPDTGPGWERVESFRVQWESRGGWALAAGLD